MTAPLTRRDISGRPIPIGQGGGPQAFVMLRPPHIEPPDGAREFIVSYSVVAAALATTAMFTFDGNGNLVVPSAAVQLPADTEARISGVSVGGDTLLGTPILTFSIRDRSGQAFLPGWDGLGLPGRSGITAVGVDVYTRVVSRGSFFGGFVVNTDVTPRYAEMMIQGWMW